MSLNKEKNDETDRNYVDTKENATINNSFYFADVSVVETRK
jgi:hypothetical protein